MPAEPIVLRNARVLTCDGPADAPLGELAPGAVMIAGPTIAWVGHDADRPRRDVVEIDCEGRLLTPGLVDCHTHAIFAGERAHEFGLRAAGASYLAIAAQGGGIVATTGPTRAASIRDLRDLTDHRLHLAQRAGTTTIEVKSGYDLTVDGELRLLRILADLAMVRRQRVVPTLLCHVVPADRRADRDAYVAELVTRLVPAVGAARLAHAVDVYCDEGAFTLAETRAILEAARAAGLGVRGHAGQFADLAAAELLGELGARSADHVEQISDAGVAALAAAGTVAVMLPGACVQLRLPVPPVERLRAAGIPLAIATDLNPGSSWSVNLQTQMWLATTHYGMTVDEAWLGVTRHGARALGLADAAGTIAVGRRADLVTWSCERPAEVPYRYDTRLVSSVWIAGEQVVLAADEYRHRRDDGAS
jgi:imidazolonepropionase